jgi:transposase
MIELLKEEIRELERQIKEHINRHPNLKQQSELLQTIPDIGERTANLLLSEIEFERYDSAPSIAAQAGVTPRKATVGNEFETDELIETRQRAMRKAFIFSGDSGTAT